MTAQAVTRHHGLTYSRTQTKSGFIPQSAFDLLTYDTNLVDILSMRMTLQEYLTANSLSSQQFAEIIGVSRITVNRYLAGTRRPELAVLYRIIKVTDGLVTADSFLSEAQKEVA